MLLFFILVTLGFIFELEKKALDIPSRQSTTNDKSLYLRDFFLDFNLVFYEWYI